MPKKKIDGWYSKRAYPHFDTPLNFADASALVKSADNVRRHAFYPFISFKLTRRRYAVSNNTAIVKTKERPLAVPSHTDGYIFAYYAKILSDHYENWIRRARISECILAYRSGIGTNIEFSNSAFDEVAARRTCTAIAFDLEKFFDNIDHARLKENWEQLIGVQRLPDDHYQVYRAITRFSEVRKADCVLRLGLNPNKPLPRPLCTARIFRDLIRGGSPSLITPNRNSFGIPQGSQISAVLSNIYMLRFDEEMHDLSQKAGAYYRRYCDDILWICDSGAAHIAPALIGGVLAKLGPTSTLNQDKTEFSNFTIRFDGSQTCDRPLQYLGFTFDGSNKRIRSQTLSKHWRKLIYAARSARKASKVSTTHPMLTFKRDIFRRFSHLGKQNLLSYGKRAEATMGTGAIRRQFRRHMTRIDDELK
jgi:RNA-directed DNA polymerase